MNDVQRVLGADEVIIFVVGLLGGREIPDRAVGLDGQTVKAPGGDSYRIREINGNVGLTVPVVSP